MPRAASVGVALIVFLSAYSVAAQLPRSGLRIDDAGCARVLRAPTLVSGEYLLVPPRGRAVPVPVADVRRLFDVDEPDKTSFVKKSIAEENAVACSTGPPAAAEIVRGIWRPLPASSPGRSTSGAHDCGGMVVVRYDDMKYGGAFEVMNNCGSPRFFWVLYDDFNGFCPCAIEAVGRRGSPDEPVELSGILHFEDALGETMAARLDGSIYRPEFPYGSGTRFRVLVTSDRPAHVYAFASDLTRKVYPLLPKGGDSAHLVYQQNRVAIPDEKGYLQLDDRPGTDYFCVLYSAQTLDFTDLVRRVETGGGDFSSRLRAAAVSWIPDSDVRYDSGGNVGFTARSKKGSAVPLIVEIAHAR